jgi:hypothetical protein
VEPGTVVDGELVVWSGDRLDFLALQDGMGRGARRAAEHARRRPTSIALFDVLHLADPRRPGRAHRYRPLVEQTSEDAATERQGVKRGCGERRRVPDPRDAAVGTLRLAVAVGFATTDLDKAGFSEK